jgi:hypothetical protein
MISYDDYMCVIQMRCWLLKLEAQEEEHQKEIKLKDKGMEQRKSNGLVVVGVLEATSLKIFGWVH